MNVAFEMHRYNLEKAGLGLGSRIRLYGDCHDGTVRAPITK